VTAPSTRSICKAEVNLLLGSTMSAAADINRDGATDALDLQALVSAILAA
jgi:hypothetical protein